MAEKNNEQQNTQEETDGQERGEQESGEAEETEETEEMEDAGGFGSFISPEAIIMMPLAILLDLIGLILVIFALDDFFITDIIGVTIISGWTFFRSRQVQIPEKSRKRVAEGLSKGTKKPKKYIRMQAKIKWLRFLAPIVELIPYIGSLLPTWTILVYFELKSS